MAGKGKPTGCSIHEQPATDPIGRCYTECAGEVIKRQAVAYWQGMVGSLLT